MHTHCRLGREKIFFLKWNLAAFKPLTTRLMMLYCLLVITLIFFSREAFILHEWTLLVTSRGGLSFVALLILSHCLMAALIIRYSYANSITCDEVLSPDPIPCFTPPPSGEWVEYTMQIPVPELPTSDAVSSQLERVVESAVKNFFDAPETYRGLWIWPPPHHYNNPHYYPPPPTPNSPSLRHMVAIPSHPVKN